MSNLPPAGRCCRSRCGTRPNLPGTSLKLGQPAGSAVPLVWAHAEYLKLLRSAVDGKVFDRIDPVYERYCEPEGRKRVRDGS